MKWKKKKAEKVKQNEEKNRLKEEREKERAETKKRKEEELQKRKENRLRMQEKRRIEMEIKKALSKSKGKGKGKKKDLAATVVSFSDDDSDTSVSESGMVLDDRSDDEVSDFEMDTLQDLLLDDTFEVEKRLRECDGEVMEEGNMVNEEEKRQGQVVANEVETGSPNRVDQQSRLEARSLWNIDFVNMQ